MPEPTLRDLLDERHKAHVEEHRIHEAAHEREHQATEQAIKMATATLDKRLDAMNEFRDQLRDQAATFVRRDVVDSAVISLRQEIATEREARKEQMGVKQGMSQTTGIIVGAIGLAATVISVVVILVNFVAR